MSSYPSGTVTLVFTDIEGSTLLLRELGERYGGALATHRRLLRDAFEAAHGHEIDTQGDSFFVAFATVRDALEAAVNAQRAIADEKWPGAAELRVRMGIHTGEPTVWDEGYLGLDVHRAARICAAGHGGQVLLSQETRELAGEVLPPGTDLKDLGEHRLKDLPRPETLFQLVIPGLRSTFPPLKVLDGKEPGALLGRERELASRVVHAVFARTHRVQPHRKASHRGFIDFAWDLRELIPSAPQELQSELRALGGDLFNLGRTATDFERYVDAVEPKLLERSLNESREMAVVSQRARGEADALERHLNRFQALVGRREQLAELAEEVDATLRRMRRDVRESPEAARTDVASLRSRVGASEEQLRGEMEGVRSALGGRGIKFKHTRHRGVYRVGSRYVVPFFDEVGIEDRRVFSSLDEAKGFRGAIRHAGLGPEIKDWRTVGKSFRASDAIMPAGPSYVRPTDEGRPRH